MIHYHGMPVTPEMAALAAIRTGHAFVSYFKPQQLSTVIEACQSFAVDNGAFSAWRSGAPVTDWRPFYDWVRDVLRVPSCDFAVIPDVIDGNEAANDRLVDEWPFGRSTGAPVWHMHESLDRLARLAFAWPRVCLGSSGEYAAVGDARWTARMAEVMLTVCDTAGRPMTKLHGLRMLNPKVFTRYPFASADSTNIGQNIGIDKNWTGSYQPVGDEKKAVRAALMRTRIESHNAPARWVP
jgi:hypothetical protein